MEYVTLNNGVKMPILGFGVYQIEDPEVCEQSVLTAIETGYRMIDTAQAYGNEEAVGKAVAKCGVPREELFIISKVWISNGGYEKAKASIDESLKKMGLDYLDLMLIHQPFNDYYGSYRAMEEAYKEGKLRAIGVANFYPDRLIDLCQFAEVPPMVNQGGDSCVPAADQSPGDHGQISCMPSVLGALCRGQKRFLQESYPDRDRREIR